MIPEPRAQLRVAVFARPVLTSGGQTTSSGALAAVPPDLFSSFRDPGRYSQRGLRHSSNSADAERAVTFLDRIHRRIREMGHYILAGDGRLIVERRANPRYDVTLEVQIGLPGGGRSIPGTVTNLSEAGLQVVLTAAVQEKDIIELECPSFRGTAEVKWWRDEGERVRAGLKFESLAPADRNAIREMISGLSRSGETETAGSTLNA